MTSNVFTEEVTYIATPCPDWCTLAVMPPVDGIHDDGRQSQDHSGPSFGEYLSTGGIEFTDKPGVVTVDVRIYTEPSGLNELTAAECRRLALDALAAAEWLEAQTSRSVGPSA